MTIITSLLQIPLYPSPSTVQGKIEGQGPLGLDGVPAITGGVVFSRVISSTIGLLTVIAFIWFFVTLLIGALGIINSGGDKAKIAEARGRITTGLIGVVVVISAVFIIRFVAELMGIPNVLNIQNMILTISP
jgi:hypothetical protein